MSKERVLRTDLRDRTTASVVFENGHSMVIESKWEAAQNNGNSYSGADWTTFGQFKQQVEAEVDLAQKRWGLPAAEITYTHSRMTLQQIERRTVKSEIHSIRRVDGGSA